MRGRRFFGILAVLLCAQPAGAFDLLEGRLQLYGFVETRAGLWTQDDPTRPVLIPGISLQPDNSHFAVSRTTLQLEADWRLHERAELQQEGRRRMSAGDFLRGTELLPGMRFD